jgi:hypothetical protein
MRLDVMRIMLDRANILDEINNASTNIGTFVPSGVRFVSQKSKDNIILIAQKLILDDPAPQTIGANFSTKSDAIRNLTDPLKEGGDAFDKAWSFSEVNNAFSGELYFLGPLGGG